MSSIALVVPSQSMVPELYHLQYRLPKDEVYGPCLKGIRSDQLLRLLVCHRHGNCQFVGQDEITRRIEKQFEMGILEFSETALKHPSYGPLEKAINSNEAFSDELQYHLVVNGNDDLLFVVKD